VSSVIFSELQPNRSRREAGHGIQKDKDSRTGTHWYFCMLCCSSHTGKLYKFKILLLERMVEKCVVCFQSECVM
jgi:hypothetical protein